MEADVCIVGAGYAGLSAGRRLSQGGKSVIVLEARDRVGGRVWSRDIGDGVRLDVGGGWLGAGQDQEYALAKEVGASIYKAHNEGEKVFATDGGTKRYRGLPKISPLALASLGLGMRRLDKMATRVPLDAPWTASKATEWDQLTAAKWLSSRFNVPSTLARELLRGVVRGTFTCDPSEVSLLHVLYLIRSATSTPCSRAKAATSRTMSMGGPRPSPTWWPPTSATPWF